MMEVVVQHNHAETKTIADLSCGGQRQKRGQALLEVISGHDHVEACVVGAFHQVDPLAP